VQVHDSRRITSSSTSTSPQGQSEPTPAWWQVEPPTFWDIFHYGFNHVGLITGMDIHLGYLGMEIGKGMGMGMEK
jgi:hypothetical protein